MTKERWQHYVKGPLWTLWEAAYLLTGNLPKRQDEFDREDLFAFEPLALTYRALKDALAAGTLEQVGRSIDKKNKRVRPASTIRWAIAQGIDVPSELDALKQADVVLAVAPVQRSAAQDAAICEALRAAGYVPRALPKREQGKPWIKFAIRAALVGVHLSFPAKGTQFDHAWDRLRSRGEIVERT